MNEIQKLQKRISGLLGRIPPNPQLFNCRDTGWHSLLKNKSRKGP